MKECSAAAAVSPKRAGIRSNDARSHYDAVNGHLALSRAARMAIVSPFHVKALQIVSIKECVRKWIAHATHLAHLGRYPARSRHYSVRTDFERRRVLWQRLVIYEDARL
jgi:hypothetical protein